MRSVSGIVAIALGLAVLAALQGSNSTGDAHVTSADLDLLLQQRSYLKLENTLASNLSLSAEDRAFFAGVMANRRNRAAESIRLLQPLIPDLLRANRTRAVVALGVLADDYEKTFQYAAAADAYANLGQNFERDMSKDQFDRAKLEAARWGLLRGAPPQSGSVNGPFTVETSRTRLGLVKVAVTIAGQQISMILDTGANLSAISRSAALRLGLQLSSNQATMEGMTAGPMPVRTAVIPELEIGKAVFRNVAVIVVEDKDMFVPPLQYMLPGSLGFPVLSALGRITFFADGRFGVGLQPTSGKPVTGNLFLQRLTPIVAAGIRGRQELFTIDTGATGSFLSAHYYQDFPQQFESQALDEMLLTGAGGTRRLPAYYAPQITLSLGGACVRMEDVPVLIKPRGISDDYFYGNFGQSALSMFPSYTFDFQNMSFTIDGPACGGSA
jgi:clan AA aspartic protease (TIGR02281 family)